MKKLISLTLSFSILFCLSSCHFNDTSTSSDNKTNAPTKVCALIFCDFTSSIDSVLIKDVAQKAYNLALTLPPGSIINARPIDDNPFVEPFFKCEMPTLKGNLAIDKNQFNQNFESFARQFGEAIIRTYKKVNSNPSNAQSSCVISTLETACNFFKGLNKNEFRFELIYFSDMIEQCANSQAGPIYICGDKYIPNKEAIMQQINKNYTPSFDLKSLIGNNISMIISTNMIGGKKCLRQDELKATWSLIFSKVGYSDADFGSFHFGGDLPSRLMPSNNNPEK